MRDWVSMAGTIDPCWLVVYRAPAEELRRLLPASLSLVEHEGCGFVNVVLCRVEELRPAWVPLSAGMSYWHIGYRIYTAHGPQQGLYFLRSDADSAIVVASGNLLTSFHFHHAGVKREGRHLQVVAPGASVDFRASTMGQDALSEGSSFSSLREAEHFLKYKPAALIVEGGSVSALRISRKEEEWKSRLVQVEEARFEYLESLKIDLRFELCYEVDPIDYVWNRAEVLK